MIIPLAALVVVQALDVLLHVVTGQIEPIRIASNLILVAGAFAAMRAAGRARLLIAGAVLVYVLLNAVFLGQNGLVNPATEALRIPLFAFVIGSVALALWLERRRRGAGTP
ncbi:MAG: hypothetical protein AAFW69_04920 [Pseudomonadota bacterium]